MDNIVCWLQDTLQRVYPHSPAGDSHTLDLVAARNERVSFQACAHNPGLDSADVTLGVTGADELHVTVRRVGYVPMAHHNTATPLDELEGAGHIPGLVPDPLLPEQTATLGPLESHAFWVNVFAPAETRPGDYVLTIHFMQKGKTLVEGTARVSVRPPVLQPRQGFPVTHWFYADALCDWYEVEPFEEKFWQIVQPYMANLVAHGGNCQYVPLFTPPTDGVKRPTQLLKVTEPAPGQYWFDFSDVRRWTRLARQCGAQYYEWTHLFTQWGVKNALRVYRRNSDPNALLWPPETGATSDKYRNFLVQFLPAFRSFLQLEGLMDRSFFHLSDEPGEEHYENYRAARALLKELAPWMKVSDALSDVRYGSEGLTDIPIPSISTARDYAQAGIPAWAYFCCGPRGRYLNRLMDTPLAKIRMSGWLFYRLKAQGFLHWGYNYWYRSQTQQLIDPFVEQSACAWPGWAYGDPFLVYPGADGPLDSIRWEAFAESLQDYALLQTLGIAPEDERLCELKDYDDFPKSAAWLRAMRQQLLAR